MNSTAKVIKYELSDAFRGRWLVAYTFFFFFLVEGLFRFGGTGAKALLSLANVVLFVIPLVSIVFGAMYLYDARDFNALLLAQPVTRRSLFGGLFIGLALPLSVGFVTGVSVPFVLHGAASHGGTLAMLLASGVLLTGVFVALAFLIALKLEEKVKGLASALMVWLFSTVIYDGLVLLFVSTFAEYPLEKPMLVLMLLNPVDLARVLLLLSFDVSALMGYTGAVFEQFFGSLLGLGVSFGALALWLAAPLGLALRAFERKDF